MTEPVDVPQMDLTVKPGETAQAIPAGVTEAEEWSDGAWARRHEVLYRCELSQIYHQKRERFFDLCDGWTKFLALTFGGVAVAKQLPATGLPWIAAVISISSAVSLVVGYAKRARVHADFSKAFIALQATIVAQGVFDEAQANRFEAEILAIEASEPRSLGALVRLAQNELARAQNQPERVQGLTFLQRRLAHFYDFDLSD